MGFQFPVLIAENAVGRGNPKVVLIIRSYRKDIAGKERIFDFRLEIGERHRLGVQHVHAPAVGTDIKLVAKQATAHNHLRTKLGSSETLVDTPLLVHIEQAVACAHQHSYGTLFDGTDSGIPQIQLWQMLVHFKQSPLIKRIIHTQLEQSRPNNAHVIDQQRIDGIGMQPVRHLCIVVDMLDYPFVIRGNKINASSVTTHIERMLMVSGQSSDAAQIHVKLKLLVLDAKRDDATIRCPQIDGLLLYIYLIIKRGNVLIGGLIRLDSPVLDGHGIQTVLSSHP